MYYVVMVELQIELSCVNIFKLTIWFVENNLRCRNHSLEACVFPGVLQMPIVFYCCRAIYSVLASLFIEYDIHFANVFSVCKITEITTKKPFFCNLFIFLTMHCNT